MPKMIHVHLCTIIAAMSLTESDAFSNSFFSVQRHSLASPSFVGNVFAAKGFGNAKDPAPSKKQKKSSAPSSSPVPASTTATAAPSQMAQSPPAAPLNDGQVALEKLRREKAEQRDAELRKIRQLQETDKQLQDTPAAIPERVAQRMGGRMLAFVGAPLFLGMGAFVVFWYLATYKDMEFEPIMVAATTIGLLLVGLLGITYSVMSASWDPDREGSALGTEEFERNLGSIKEGLGRSKENAILRDRMATMSPADIKAMNAKLDAKDGRKQSLESKLQDELD